MTRPIADFYQFLNEDLDADCNVNLLEKYNVPPLDEAVQKELDRIDRAAAKNLLK